MLVTPEGTLFFRNPYTGYEADTIEKVAECRTEKLFGETADNTCAAEAIESFVPPAVTGGSVRAAGFRLRRVARLCGPRAS